MEVSFYDSFSASAFEQKGTNATLDGWRPYPAGAAENVLRGYRFMTRGNEEKGVSFYDIPWILHLREDG